VILHRPYIAIFVVWCFTVVAGAEEPAVPPGLNGFDPARLLEGAKKKAREALERVLPDPGGLARPPAISKVADVLAYGNRQAAARPRRVKVRGAVTFVDPSRPWFFLQDGSAATVVTQGFGAVPVKAGDLVEAEGTTRAGTFATYVDLAAVTITGAAMMPLQSGTMPFITAR